MNPTPRMLRQFAAAWVVLCLVSAAVHGFTDGDLRAVEIRAGIALVGVLGLVLPGAIRWLFIAVTVVTFPIGVVVSNLLLAGMFFLVVTPLGLLLRCRGRDPLQLKPDRARKTFWHQRRHPDDPTRYLKQY